MFMSSFIPRTLGQVYDPERDIELMKAGKGDQLIYNETLGADPTARTPATPGAAAAKTDGDDEAAQQEQPRAEGTPETTGSADGGEADSAGEEEDDSEEEEDVQKGPRGFRHEDRDAKKVSLCLFSALRFRLHGVRTLISRNGKRLSKKRSARSARPKCPKPRNNA